MMRFQPATDRSDIFMKSHYFLILDAVNMSISLRVTIQDDALGGHPSRASERDENMKTQREKDKGTYIDRKKENERQRPTGIVAPMAAVLLLVIVTAVMLMSAAPADAGFESLEPVKLPGFDDIEIPLDSAVFWTILIMAAGLVIFMICVKDDKSLKKEEKERRKEQKKNRKENKKKEAAKKDGKKLEQKEAAKQEKSDAKHVKEHAKQEQKETKERARQEKKGKKQEAKEEKKRAQQEKKK
jgi:hypothetical protein